jgi:dTMP kinase
METSVAGRFITLEGGEGAGKSTHVKRLAAALAGAGIEAVATREPGGAPGAEEIRRILVEGEPGRWAPLTETLLHFAARAEHVARTIRPALDRGAWVVCDRFVDSTMAYQGYAQGVGRAKVEEVARAVLGAFRPDLTLILDVPADQGLARSAKRGGSGTRYESMGLEFHAKLREAFLDIAKREPDRCFVIDATEPKDAVAAAILAAVRERLQPKGL